MSKSFKQYSLSSLRAALKREIYYPSSTFKGYLFRYISALLFITLIIPFSSILHSESMTALLLVVVVVGAAWVGGLGSALVSAALAIVFIYLSFFYPQMPTETFFLESIILLFIAVIAGTGIYYSKKIDQFVRFRAKEKVFEARIAAIEGENEKLKAEIQSRDEFLSIASHELKTPLTTTLLKLQTALHNIRSTSFANFSVQNLMDMLLSSEQQTQRLSKMIGDLLDVSLVRTGRIELELEKADLVVITKDVIKSFVEKAKKENIAIRLETADSVQGKFDKLRIEQVLINLLSNAMKYGKQKQIDVRVEKANDIGKVTVTDHGIGIPLQQKEKIFKLFDRGIQNGQRNGLGVGLYITNQIVKAHKGKLNLESKEGKGSTFCVEIPLN